MPRNLSIDPVVFPRIPRGKYADELVRTPTPTGNPPETGDLNDPEEQYGPSLRYHRRPYGGLRTVDLQDFGIGLEIKQAGAGRAIIPLQLSFPVQSPTPEPDRRIIARPLPQVSRDSSDVIRPPQLN